MTLNLNWSKIGDIFLFEFGTNFFSIAILLI